jgi:hypothetical protein
METAVAHQPTFSTPQDTTKHFSTPKTEVYFSSETSLPIRPQGIPKMQPTTRYISLFIHFNKNALHIFRRFRRPSSGAQTEYTKN